MQILSRYIIGKHIGPIIFSIAVIILIFLSNYLIERFSMLLSRDVPVKATLELLVLSLSWVFALAVPMSVLLATLMVFGKMSEDNEITALKASGYGLHQVMFPVLTLAVLLTVGLFFFNDRVLPDSNYRLELLMRAINKKKPSLQFQAGVFSDDQLIKNYNLLFDEISNTSDWVYGVTIFDKSDSRLHRTVVAEKGTLTYSGESDKIIMVLYNGEIHEVDNSTQFDYKRSSFEQYTIRIPVVSSELVRSEDGRRSDRSKSIAMMKSDIVNSKKNVEKRFGIIESRVNDEYRQDFENLNDYLPGIYSLRTSDFIRKTNGGYEINNFADNPVITKINEKPSVINKLRSDVATIDSQIKYQNKLLVEIYKKYSISFACIVFVLVGVPLGVKARHGGVAVSAGFSMLFFLLYWIFLIGGEQLADRKLLEPWLAMWAPNIIVGIMGIWLTSRMIKESTFLESGRMGFVIRMLVKDKTE